MAEPTIQLGGGNWAGKTDNLLGYYKEGERFYKQDFTFSRSTTGTYTDSEGYIQEMPYNLLQQSNDFDTTWFNSHSNETGGQSGYDGTNDAWLINKTAASGYIRQDLPANGVLTLSVYAKKGSLNWIRVIATGGTSTPSTWFDLENGVIGSADFFTLSSSIESVGNGYYRCSITFNVGTINGVRYYPADGNNNVSGTSGSIYIQDAQLVKGTSAKTYFPTTTRLNIPRVDYLNNSNGSLILEPQRSNLVTYSSDFSNVAWIKDNVTITSDASTSPEGISNATKLIPNTSTALHRLRSNTITISTNGAYSAFVKADGYSKVALREDNAVGNYASFDLSDGSVLDENASGVADIDSYGNGWYRIYFVDNAVSATCQLSFYVLPDSYTSGSPTATNWAADGTKGIYIYGAQVEEGSYPTTLINTSGSSVTRNADVCSITNVAHRIGQTEGTLFYDGYYGFEPAEVYLFLQENLGNGVSDSIYIQKYGSNSIAVQVFDGNDLQIQLPGGSYVFGQRIKIAFAYKQNDFAFYINNVQIGVSTSGLIPTLNSVQIGTYPSLPDTNNFIASNGTNEVKLYNTRLSNSELATLTTL